MKHLKNDVIWKMTQKLNNFRKIAISLNLVYILKYQIWENEGRKT